LAKRFLSEDFASKVSRRTQKEYFGKKGMTLHVDVFFVKENEQVKKKVYFTAVYRCEQGLVDSLCLGDVVLAKVLCICMYACMYILSLFIIDIISI